MLETVIRDILQAFKSHCVWTIFCMIKTDGFMHNSSVVGSVCCCPRMIGISCVTYTNKSVLSFFLVGRSACPQSERAYLPSSGCILYCGATLHPGVLQVGVEHERPGTSPGYRPGHRCRTLWWTQVWNRSFLLFPHLLNFKQTFDPGSHCCNYYPAVLFLSWIASTHLKIKHP